MQANLSALESALSKQDSALEHSQLPDQLQPVETPFAGPASHESFLGQAQRGAPHGQVSLSPPTRFLIINFYWLYRAFIGEN